MSNHLGVGNGRPGLVPCRERRAGGGVTEAEVIREEEGQLGSDPSRSDDPSRPPQVAASPDAHEPGPVHLLKRAHGAVDGGSDGCQRRPEAFGQDAARCLKPPLLLDPEPLERVRCDVGRRRTRARPEDRAEKIQLGRGARDLVDDRPGGALGRCPRPDPPCESLHPLRRRHREDVPGPGLRSLLVEWHGDPEGDDIRAGGAHHRDFGTPGDREHLVRLQGPGGLGERDEEGDEHGSPVPLQLSPKGGAKRSWEDDRESLDPTDAYRRPDASLPVRHRTADSGHVERDGTCILYVPDPQAIIFPVEAGKGAVKRLLEKATDLSRAQITRLVGPHRRMAGRGR